MVSLKTYIISMVVAVLAVASVVVFFTVKEKTRESKLIQLQNELARKDKTIETQKGVFERLIIQTQSVMDLLAANEAEYEKLKKQLKESEAKVLSANALVIQLREKLKASSKPPVVVTPVDEDGGTTVGVQQTEDFGPFQVTCRSVIGPVHVSDEDEGKLGAEMDFEFSQTRPFKVAVVVSQDKEGRWKTTSTSSEDIFKIDVELAAINPRILEPKWYENIALNFDLGVGTSPGALAGVGASYSFGKIEVGPKVWVVGDRNGIVPYIGGQFTWRPFHR